MLNRRSFLKTLLALPVVGVAAKWAGIEMAPQNAAPLAETAPTAPTAPEGPVMGEVMYTPLHQDANVTRDDKGHCVGRRFPDNSRGYYVSGSDGSVWLYHRQRKYWERLT